MRLLFSLFVGSLIVASCASDSSSTPPSTATDSTTSVVAADTEPDDTEPDDTIPADTIPADPVPDTSEPTTSGTVETTAPPEPASDFETIGFGEYDVGVSTITVTDVERDRPLTVDVWFPLADDTAGDPHRYSFVTGDFYESPAAISADPSAISSDGPFPLVVYSHGSGGQRYIASNYTETIASHGYVVVAPDHTGNTAVERVTDTSADSAVTALNRPQDVRAVIAAMVDPESAETAGFVGATDPERVAVTGHSLGGFTSYAVASGYANDLGDVGPEPRLDAIIPLAPAVGGNNPRNQLLSDGRLEAVDVPSLVIAGTNDQTTPIDPHVERAWELTGSEPHFRLELIDAQHQTFTDLCDYLDAFATGPPPDPLVLETVEELGAEGCSPGDMPIDRAQELTNTFAIAFLDSIFDGDEMIDPNETAIPEDVNYLVK